MRATQEHLGRRLPAPSRWLPHRVFYGWWIVLAGLFVSALGTGFSFHGLGVFIQPLQNEFGWDRTAIAGAFSLARLEHGGLGPVEGYLVDRLGARRMMLIGVPIMAMGFILIAFVRDLPSFYLIFVLAITLGSSLGFATPLSAAIANWFQRYRGRAFGIMWTGHGLAGLPVFFLGWLVAELGWRWAAALAGVTLLVVGTPAALIVHHSPEDVGLRPDGDPDHRPPPPAPAPTLRPASRWRTREMNTVDFTPTQAIKTSAFWLISLSQGLRQMVTAAVLLHFAPMMQDRGMEQTAAAALLGAMVLITIPGRLVLPWLGDSLNKRLLLAAGLATIGGTIFVMGHSPSLVVFLTAMVVFSVIIGGLSALPNPLRADYFGRRHYATIQGWMNPVSTIGLLIGPLAAARAFDVTGSYTIAFDFFALASLVAALLMLAVRRPMLRTAVSQGA